MPGSVRLKSPADGDWGVAVNWDTGIVPDGAGFDLSFSAAAAPVG